MKIVIMKNLRQSLLILALVALPTIVLAESAAPPKPLDGLKLYERDCADCHRALNKTDLVGGRSASRIKSAIVVFGVMNSLKHLTDAEIAAIAATLVQSEAGVKTAFN